MVWARLKHQKSKQGLSTYNDQKDQFGQIFAQIGWTLGLLKTHIQNGVKKSTSSTFVCPKIFNSSTRLPLCVQELKTRQAGQSFVFSATGCILPLQRHGSNARSKKDWQAKSMVDFSIYPLVNCHITNWKTHFQWTNRLFRLGHFQ